MEDIISKLAEIETAASHIMDDVAQQKKALAAQYDSAVQEFDRSIEEDIEKKTAQIRRELEVQMEEKLAAQKADTEQILQRMETNYNQRHTELAQEIYNRILRM
ncbi:MAG TPA: hypothetical protein H9809_04140 [Candidatus Blautia pullicola]|uniref:ATPase n=1 Tax=Candidatus Blautia pullicola TaxID=2838498 RepID=A0A9D2FR08_9FIRM|nr:hypothetical protein [Candidatus Blautia pullicola]